VLLHCDIVSTEYKVRTYKGPEHISCYWKEVIKMGLLKVVSSNKCYEVGMICNGITFILNFMKISHSVQLLEGGVTDRIGIYYDTSLSLRKKCSLK
jgi:hypothetical protein